MSAVDLKFETSMRLEEPLCCSVEQIVRSGFRLLEVNWLQSNANHRTLIMREAD